MEPTPHTHPMNRLASGLYVPAELKESAAKKYKQKAAQQKAALAVRPSRSERRAAGNKRALCPVCDTPVKAKNFTGHFLRLHAESVKTVADIEE